MNLRDLLILGEQAKTEPVYPDALFPPSMYYRFFKLLAAALKPRLSVVLGVCGGGDCLHLAQGWPEGKVIGVDIVYDHPEQLAHIKDTCQNFRFWKGDSVESAKLIGDAFGKVEILFIDTVHVQEATIAEYEAWKQYLAPGAIVCFDDLFRPGMEDVWNSLPEPKARMDWLHDGTYPHGGGFGVLVMPEMFGYAEAVKAPDYELGC